MAKLLAKIASPTALLYIFLVVTQIATGLYLSVGAEPPPAFALLYGVGFLWVIGWWLQQDSRKRGVGWVFDMGLFLYIAWPLIVPYYLFKTRGAGGLLAIFLFIGVYLVATFLGVLLYALLAP